jgi:hypothetical protein
LGLTKGDGKISHILGDRLMVGPQTLNLIILVQIQVSQQIMKTIIKKIDKEWLDLILVGKKAFELRVADFQIEEGDILKLEEYTNDDVRKPTGRSIKKKVKYLRKVDLKKWIEKQPELLEKGFYVIQFD